MQNLPHNYSVTATANVESTVTLAADRVANIESAPPEQFGGPGDLWSPESLLVAAVADCFILSFRAVAKGFKLEWISLECAVNGVLERVDNLTQFTEFEESVVLVVPAGTDEAKAKKVIDKAEHACLITNSLSGQVHLTAEIRVAD